MVLSFTCILESILKLLVVVPLHIIDGLDACVSLFSLEFYFYIYRASFFTVTFVLYNVGRGYILLQFIYFLAFFDREVATYMLGGFQFIMYLD